MFKNTFLRVTVAFTAIIVFWAIYGFLLAWAWS